MKKIPQKFDFDYFESLPQDKIQQSAQEFVDKKFPSGSYIRDALNEFTEAGARCGRRIGLQGELFYGCYYEKSGSGFPEMFVTVEWKIILYP